MPLAFNCISHGTVAFGFFNIESDMLLLEHYFFFASDFCRYVEDIVEWDNEKPYVTTWPIFCIESSEAIGDLMGAIHGVRFSGFIGELYKNKVIKGAIMISCLERLFLHTDEEKLECFAKLMT